MVQADEIRTLYDVVVMGTGPAGLQAAIHAARAKVSVLVLGRKHKSSLYKAHVENYCCLSGVSGEELLIMGEEQATASGADFLQEDVLDITPTDKGFDIRTESDHTVRTRTLILAMGITRNKLGVPGEKELLGKGVSYCVDCDANFYKNQKVAVVGGESAAVSGAMTLLFYASAVHLVAESLQVSDRMIALLEASEVHLHLGRKVKAIQGTEAVTGLVTDKDEHLEVSGVFIEQGAKGAVELAATLGVALDEKKFQYIQTDKSQQTNIGGIFAAGDICGPPWQMAKAVGEGCVAGLAAAKSAKKMKRKDN